jgi:hypothetical protein
MIRKRALRHFDRALGSLPGSTVGTSMVPPLAPAHAPSMQACYVYSPIAIRHGLGQTTINAVASGPMKIDTRNHRQPLRPLAWANPALIKASVPQYTAYCERCTPEIIGLTCPAGPLPPSSAGKPSKVLAIESRVVGHLGVRQEIQEGQVPAAK